MSLEDYTLTHHGITRTMAEWGCESGVFKHTAGGNDSLSVTIKESITSAPRFTPLDPITLRDQTGAIRFYGVVMNGRDGFQQSYDCPGGDYWLAGTPIQQEWQFRTDRIFTGQPITLARLGHLLLNDTIAEIVAQCVAQGAPITLDSSVLPSYKSPENLQRDLDGVSAIAALAKWDPWLQRRWRYSGEPEMQWFSVLRPGHSYGLPANGDIRTVTLGEMEGGSAAPKFRPLHELLIKSLKINWISQNPFTVGAAGDIDVGGVADGTVLVCDEYDSDIAIASPDNGAFARREMTIELRRGEFNGTTRQPNEVKATDLAKRLGAPYFNLWLAMSWQQKSSYCDFSIIPGELWRAAEADPLYASAGSLCQVVTHDLKAGTTSVQCGPPSQLGFYDPRLANRLRQNPDANAAGGQTFGFKPKDNGDSGGGSTARINVLAFNGVDYSPKVCTVLLDSPVETGDEFELHCAVKVAGTPTHKKIVLPGLPVAP